MIVPGGLQKGNRKSLGQKLTDELRVMGPLDAERACAGVCSLAAQDTEAVARAAFLYGADAFCLSSGGELALSPHPEGAESSSEQTQAMSPGGNLPPEAAGGKAEAGPRGYVYAVSAALYHLICGVPADDGISRLLLDTLKSPSDRGITLRPELEAVILKGLSVDPAARYASPEELFRALREVLPEDRKEESVSRRRAFFLGIALLFTAGILAALIFFKGQEPEYRWNIRWETGDNPLAGANEVDAGEIRGESAVLRYEAKETALPENGLPDGWYGVLAVFHERLDASGVPYALGTGADEPRTVFVRVAAEDFTEAAAELLPCGADMEIGGISRTVLGTVDSAYTGELFFEEREQGGEALIIPMADGKTGMARALMKLLRDAGEEKLFLTVRGMRIAEGALDEEAYAGRFHFEKLYLANAGAAEKEALVRLLSTSRRERLPEEFGLALTEVQFLDWRGWETEGSLSGTFDRSFEEAWKETAASHGGELAVRYEETGEVLSVSAEVSAGDFPEGALAKAEELCTALDYQKLPAVRVDLAVRASGTGRILYLTVLREKERGAQVMQLDLASGGDASCMARAEEYVKNSRFYSEAEHLRGREWNYDYG